MKRRTFNNIILILIIKAVLLASFIAIKAINITGMYMISKANMGKTAWDFSFISTPTFAIIIGVSLVIANLIMRLK